METWSEDRSNRPYAQEAGVPLPDPTYAPHALVCNRVRGVFKKKNLGSPKIAPGQSFIFFTQISFRSFIFFTQISRKF